MEGDDDQWLEEAEVMSEVHIGSKPNLQSTVSVFSISSSPLAPSSVDLGYVPREASESTEEVEEISSGAGNPVGSDEQGDLILPRRKKRREADEVKGDVILVHHHITTRLPEVGLQIWKGALLLSDFILQRNSTTGTFNDVVAIELGAGTGLAGLIMARVARLVFITDRGTDILDNCTRNVVMNSRSLKHGEASVRVRELDWEIGWPPEGDHSNMDELPYRWSAEDRKVAEDVSVLLAADVVYSPDITDAFFSVLKKLMPVKSRKVLYLSLEKRYNFSLRDHDVVAHGYKHFRSFFTTDELTTKRNSEEHPNLDAEEGENAHHFTGRRINISEIQQFVMNYDRGKDLELWEIKCII